MKPQDTQNYELLRPSLNTANRLLRFSVNDCGVSPALFSDAHLTLGGLVVGKISILEVDAGTRVLWLMKLVSYVIIEDFKRDSSGQGLHNRLLRCYRSLGFISFTTLTP